MRFQYFLFCVVLMIVIQYSTSKTRNFTPVNEQNIYLLENERVVVPLTFQESSVSRSRHPKDSDLFNGQMSPPKQSIQRSKRSVTECSNLTSCAGRCSKKRMFHNIKENKNDSACYCDSECDKIFKDCCADYLETCGTPKKVSLKKTLETWKCFSMKQFPFKIWMVAGCKPDWPRKDWNSKNCAKFSATNPKVSWIMPVIAGRTTYRNRYCALCNDVKTFKYWKIKKLECDIKAPRKYTTVKKLQHYDKYCNGSRMLFKQTRGVRYCYDVINTCTYFDDKVASMDCRFGMTGLLSSRLVFAYRNHGCFLCNTRQYVQPINITCGPRFIPPSPILKEGKSNILTDILGDKLEDSRKPGPTKTQCLAGQLYDNAMKICRNLFVYNASTSDNFLRQFAVRLLFKRTNNTSCSTAQTRNTTNDTRKNLLAFLNNKFDTANGTQWHFHDLDVHVNVNNTKALVTFQILRTWSTNETVESSFFVDVLEIGEFNQIFVGSGNISVCTYVLTKVETKEAVCLDNKTHPMEDPRNGTVTINVTKYRSGQYLVYQQQNETRIALCQDSRPTHCLYHVPVRNRSHWKEFANRSIYSFVTESWFHYGEYSLVNRTLWLCLMKDYNRQTHSSLIQSKSIHHTILSYGTTVSLSMSILSLSTLLVVYSMFSALRNLPGKNLMLFSATLALAQTTWLLQGEIASLGTGLCPAINIVMQYFFLASFSCSSSIAIQSFLTFNALARGKLRQRSGGRSFLKYAMFGLGLPCLFVVVCLILDTTKMVPFKYGTSDSNCWFSSTDVLYIGFLYPVFFLLLCNMSLFFATLRVIYKCTKASQRLAENTAGANRKHVGIYIRMSTMMGFTWLCAVLNIFFPGELVFQYIFVFVNGFQGLYLSLAFLSTENVRKIIFGKSEKGLDSTTSQKSIALRVL